MFSVNRETFYDNREMFSDVIETFSDDKEIFSGNREIFSDDTEIFYDNIEIFFSSKEFVGKTMPLLVVRGGGTNIRSSPYASKNSRRRRGVLDIFLPTNYLEDPNLFLPEIIDLVQEISNKKRPGIAISSAVGVNPPEGHRFPLFSQPNLGLVQENRTAAIEILSHFI